MCAAVLPPADPVRMLRREDMAVLDFRFQNLSRTGAAGAHMLVATSSAAPSFVIVDFPPQALLEQITGLPNASTGVKAAALSGSSRLVFQVPAGTSIPFTAAGLLAWTGLQNVVGQTSLECVWGLPFRPAAPSVTWSHALEPVTGPTGVTGLWHTRLTVSSGAPPGLGSPPPPVPLQSGGNPRANQPVAGSLTAVQRQQIANAMTRKPVLAKELILSALGATVDLAGDWTGISGISLTGYQHRTVLGRDSVVHLVQRGFLLPFGFPAQITTRTERRLDLGLIISLSRLIVLLPEIEYSGAPGLPHDGRAFPFARVHLRAPLAADVSTTAETIGELGFWVRAQAVGTPLLMFNLTAEDKRRHPMTLSAPFAFLRGDLNSDQLRSALAAYEQKARDIPLPAEGRLELAPPANPADTTDTSTMDVEGLRIGAEPAVGNVAALQAAGRLAAYPRLIGAECRLPALAAFPPRSTATLAAVPAAPVRLALDDTYVKNGLTAAREVYAAVQQATPVSFAPPVTDSGGVAALAQRVSGLSRTAGLIGGDLNTFKNGRFEPTSYFPAPPAPGDLPPARLLGFLNLAELVSSVPTDDAEAVPHVITEIIRPASHQPPEAVRTTLTWRPKLKVGTFCNGVLQTTPETSIDLRNTTLAPLDGAAPQVDSRGELRHFILSFVGGILVVRFDRLAYTSRPGASPSLDVKVSRVEFGEDLRFLNRLRDYLPTPPNGPRVKVDAQGIEVGHGLAIPSISAGVFLLQNLMLSATVTLPFDGSSVRARFELSTRDHPFLVTVSAFGGGGFFAITVESGEVKELEAQLEFGAAVALNLGVASGSVSVTAAIYVHIKNKRAKLEGFLRAVGILDVLGIISISVEFYLSLSYDSGTKLVHGHAEVTVRVRVAFFSQSVTLQVDRDFGGGDDPDFAEAFPEPQPWADRCAAFAKMEGT